MRHFTLSCVLLPTVNLLFLLSYLHNFVTIGIPAFTIESGLCKCPTLKSKNVS